MIDYAFFLCFEMLQFCQKEKAIGFEI